MAQDTKRQRVVWFEGMTLDPHHFQQFDRYHRGLLNFRTRSIARYDFGVVELAINKEALANGLFSLVRCSGVTTDGLVFNIPDNNPVPNSRNIQESFPAAEDKIIVFLAVPVERQNGKNCLLDGTTIGDTIRFRTETIIVNDENTGANECQITVAQPNLQIRFSTEPMENFNVIPIAEINRRPDGGFALNDSFIPTCLSISASERLISITNGILELLVGNRASLWDHHRQKFSGQMEFTTSDLETTWRLHIMNSIIPLMNHYHSTRNQHPEELYSVLTVLAGQLTTFSFDTAIHPREFPKYDHNNPSACFNQLEKTIHLLLKGVITTNYVAINLEKREETLLVGLVDNASLITTPQLFLQCSGDIPEQKMTQDLPRILRIASLQDIPNLEQYALPGLSIIYSPRPPLGLPTRPDLHYFRLEKVGPLWDSILNNLSIAIRIPPGFKGIQIKLLAMTGT